MMLELPDEIAAGLERVVKSGWFTDEKDAVRTALRDLISDRRFATQERQQLADLEWALSVKRERQ